MREESRHIVLFKGNKIRRTLHEERWYFSVVDVLGVLTDSKNPAVYWRVLKKRLSDEGSDETVTKCNALKMPAAGWRERLEKSWSQNPARRSCRPGTICRTNPGR